MSTLTITRGLPGSGKTTWAAGWVAEDPGARARVNRDDLRSMMHNGTFISGLTEPRIIVARNATIAALLRKGVEVVCDDTNLPQRVVRDLMKLARRAGADFAVRDFTRVPLKECIARDAARERPVGEQVIRSMHASHLHGRDLPLPIPEDPDAAALRPYEPKPGTPRAALVDVDGTTALMNGRSPYDETLVHEDLPNTPVINVVRALHAAGHQIVVMSGRTEACRQGTARWLERHLGMPIAGLHMRKIGDHRPDYLVKAELFDAHVRDHYDVACVLDDRRQVVSAWRAMGLTVLQVADGDF
ncbi:5'-hydroxyl kinase [Sphaerisporangium album]|uniref:5'-hydroxyl kinase n=1 Tax=Sphaerisporangium album TaxID=509200 RepID=A0A367FA11_9ACTN|nr:AAA family ATPase [Sphaerisporangium album]RCG27213.1 5'-hydroxyl kinase [Sphaerisporangium album]